MVSKAHSQNSEALCNVAHQACGQVTELKQLYGVLGTLPTFTINILSN